jgi:hypothetical protein
MYPPFKEKGGFPSTTATALARLQLDSPNGDGLPTGNRSTESIQTEERGGNRHNILSVRIIITR